LSVALSNILDPADMDILRTTDLSVLSILVYSIELCQLSWEVTCIEQSWEVTCIEQSWEVTCICNLGR